MYPMRETRPEVAGALLRFHFDADASIPSKCRHTRAHAKRARAPLINNGLIGKNGRPTQKTSLCASAKASPAFSHSSSTRTVAPERTPLARTFAAGKLERDGRTTRSPAKPPRCSVAIASRHPPPSTWARKKARRARRPKRSPNRAPIREQ